MAAPWAGLVTALATPSPAVRASVARSPTTTNAGPDSLSARHVLTMISGPIPAGSPRERAMGAALNRTSPDLDGRRVAQIAKLTLGDHGQLLAIEPVLNLLPGQGPGPTHMLGTHRNQVQAGVGADLVRDLT